MLHCVVTNESVGLFKNWNSLSHFYVFLSLSPHLLTRSRRDPNYSNNIGCTLWVNKSNWIIWFYAAMRRGNKFIRLLKYSNYAIARNNRIIRYCSYVRSLFKFQTPKRAVVNLQQPRHRQGFVESGDSTWQTRDCQLRLFGRRAALTLLMFRGGQSCALLREII